MFGNLKSKIDVTDLKKLASPQALTGMTAGSRQRSSQHTPGSLTPKSRHSRQASTASLQGLGLPVSPPMSPSDSSEFMAHPERMQELEREVQKLRSALETQQDAALERLNAKEQEWRSKVQEEKDKLSSVEGKLEVAKERERKLQQQVDTFSTSKKQASEQLREAQGLEAKVVEIQDNCDQMEGLNSQETAKIKHMLLNTNGELETVTAELARKTEALTNAEARLSSMTTVEDRIRLLSEEKTEWESQVAGLNHKLSTINSRYNNLEETKNEETQHLKERIATLEQRHSQATLQETDKVQALMKEREMMEHRMEEARQQLNNIKSSWSEKITALENQIQNLNSKMLEDQADLKKSEEQNNALQAELSALKEKIVSVEAEKTQIETSLSNEITRQKEDLGAVRFKLKNVLSEKEQEICELMEDLKVKKEESTASHEKLKSNENKISLLETQCNNQESELTKLKDKFSEVETELQASQNKNKSLQDSLQKERTNVELLGKSKLEMQSKLDTLTSEKNRLLQNLDEYVEKVSFAESSAKELEESHQKKCSEFLELEAKLQQVESDSEELRQQLKSSEEELQQKIESSDTVTLLRDATKALEDELSEKKQALKVQGQRLADMKKTIQREFKLSADTTDHVPESRSEFRPPQTTSPVPAAFSLPNNIQMGMMAMNGSGGGEEVVNNTYLKHVIIKYLTSREYEAVHLTRAVATLLHMTPEEERLLRETLEWKMSWFGSKPNLGKGQNALTIPPSQ